jgi:hypothetical protein
MLVKVTLSVEMQGAESGTRMLSVETLHTRSLQCVRRQETSFESLKLKISGDKDTEDVEDRQIEGRCSIQCTFSMHVLQEELQVTH